MRTAAPSNAEAAMAEPLLRVTGLQVDFGARAAISDVAFDLFAGETVGLVGESGSGKSTLARAVLCLVRSKRGSVKWHGQDLLRCSPSVLRGLRRELQIVFQDPLASLDPRMTIGEIIAEPLHMFEPGAGAEMRRAKVAAMLERVGLSADTMNRYPHEFSGGQCQRVGIARSMILSPKLLICDEPVSSLDVSIQGQIVNLLLDLQRDAGTAMLFISHNLAVVRHLSHRILVMYAGKVVENAPRETLFARPIHPYSRALLAAVPSAIPGPRGIRRQEPHSPAPASPMASLSRSLAPLGGCAFRDRCAFALPKCASVVPPLAEVAAGHRVACHRASEFMANDSGNAH